MAVVVILAVFIPTVIVAACVVWKCKKNKLPVRFDSKEPSYHEIGISLRDDKNANHEKPDNYDVILQPNSAYRVTTTNERHNDLNTLQPNSADGAIETYEVIETNEYYTQRGSRQT